MISKHKIKGFLKNNFGKLLTLNLNFKLLSFALVAVLGVSYFIYQHGFAYEVSVNGKSVGFVKKVAQVEEATASVEDTIKDYYGEEAFHKDEITNEKVREKEVLETEELVQAIMPELKVFKPAFVLKVDGENAVAVDSKEEIDTALQEIKEEIFTNVEYDLQLEDLDFAQNIEVIEEDVLVHRIYDKEIAKLVLQPSNKKEAKERIDVTQVSTVARVSSVNVQSDTNVSSIAKMPLDVIATLEEKTTEEIPFEKETKNDSNSYVGTSKVSQKGTNGELEIITKITLLNGKVESEEVIKETVLKEPVTEITLKGTKKRPAPVAQTTRTAAVYNGDMGSSIVAEARRYLGIPYRLYGQSPSTGFDCAGLTSYVYGQFGYNLPKSASAQRNAGYARVSVSNLKPGDIVTYTGHVGIYIGGGRMIHAPFPGRNVETISIYSVRGLIGGIRPYA